MRVLLLPKYGRRGASSRLRFYQYVPHLTAAGFSTTVSPLFDDAYVAKRSQNRGSAARAAGMLSLIRTFLQRARIVESASQYDLVFMHCELFPYFPPLLENRLKQKRVPYVVDYDDAIFHNYDLHRNPLVRRWLGNKIADVLRGAAAVIGGCEYLAEYARRVHSRVTVLPTVVDLNRYPLPEKSKNPNDPFTIGWIGSFSTMPYLNEIEAPVQAFCRKHCARVIVVGAGKARWNVDPVEYRQWSEETEVADCFEFNTGIMPLPDTPWTRGKCGYKLIQYMACGLPVVASPVGVNREIVEQGENGFLAEMADDWQIALDTLCQDRAMACAMGKQGRQKVEQHYSLTVAAPKLVAVLRDCIKM